MLRKISFIPILFMVFGHVAQAQIQVEDNTEIDLQAGEFRDTAHQTRILLIPFEKSMYNSDADREMMSASEINYEQLVYKFRYALMIMLRNRVSPYYETKNLIEDPVRDSVHYLAKLYQSIGYKSVNYNETKIKIEKVSTKKILKGQLSVPQNDNEKITKAVVNIPSILEFINSELGSDLFVFISMFEIKNDLSDYTEVGTNNYKRTLKIHFNIINLNGKEVAQDIAKINFPSKLNNIDDIIKKTFPDLCDQILMKIPQPKTIKKKIFRTKTDE